MSKDFDSHPPLPAEGLYPIRTVAAVTGVNPVTLRAWERRYNLLSPTRTPKGHRLYTREQIEKLKHFPMPVQPADMDEWMIPVAKNIDLEKVQFPLILVQEYGLNLFRLASSVRLSLDEKPNCRLLLGHKVTAVSRAAGPGSWSLGYEHQGKTYKENFDFLINAAGFKTGKIDDMLGYKRERLVEFKAAYVSRWDTCDTPWPEVVFYGERGTPQGMAQFTP